MNAIAKLLAAATLVIAGTSPALATVIDIGNTTPTSRNDCSPSCTPTIQTVYSSSYFGSSPVLISSVSLWFGAQASTGNFTVSLSTSANRVGSLSTSYAGNRGQDVMTLFSGTLPTTRDGDGYTAFEGDGFLYDPSQGDLLIEIRSDGTGNAFTSNVANALAQRVYDLGVGSTEGYVGQVGYAFDARFGFAAPPAPVAEVPMPVAEDVTPSPVISQPATGQVEEIRVKVPPVEAAISVQPVDEQVAPVPEPASWAMMIVGLGAVGSVMRRRQRTSVAPRLA